MGLGGPSGKRNTGGGSSNQSKSGMLRNMGGPLINAGMGIAEGLLGMALGDRRENRAHQRQKDLMGIQLENQQILNQQGHDLAYDMWLKTNYSAQMEQLREAGLNPALLYGKGGAGGQLTGGSGGAAAGGSASQAGMYEVAMRGQQKQLEALEANIKNASKDLDVKNKQMELTDAEISKRGSEQANIEADTNLKDAQKENLVGIEREALRQSITESQSRTALNKATTAERNANRQVLKTQFRIGNVEASRS